jgi:hypothetical protein
MQGSWLQLYGYMMLQTALARLAFYSLVYVLNYGLINIISSAV